MRIESPQAIALRKYRLSQVGQQEVGIVAWMDPLENRPLGWPLRRGGSPAAQARFR